MFSARLRAAVHVTSDGERSTERSKRRFSCLTIGSQVNRYIVLGKDFLVKLRD